VDPSPSDRSPYRHFFGLASANIFFTNPIPLAVSPDKALNSFFPMPFQNTPTSPSQRRQGKGRRVFISILTTRACAKPLAADTPHSTRQVSPAIARKRLDFRLGFQWRRQSERQKNLDGKDNYTWLEATGRGHFVGVTCPFYKIRMAGGVKATTMFFVDGESLPSINGTGSEDYFLGAWISAHIQFAYGSMGAPVKGEEHAGSRSSVYRFHLDSPIPFTKSLRSHHRTRARQCPLRQFLFRRLLYHPNPTPLRPLFISRSPHSAPLSGRRPGNAPAPR